MLCTQGPDFDTGVVTIPSDASVSNAYTQVATLQLCGRAQSVGMMLQNLSGGNALDHFKFTRSMIKGAHANNSNAGTGEIQDWLVDTDFNTASDEVIDIITGASPPNVQTLAAGSNAQLHLFDMEGIAEIGVWIRSTSGTSVRVAGNIKYDLKMHSPF